MTALAAAVALLAGERDTVWWSALAVGTANTLVGSLGWAAATGVVGGAAGAPGMELRRAGADLRTAASALCFGGLVVVALAGSVLWTRHRARSVRQGPVTSAHERAMLMRLYGPPPQRPRHVEPSDVPAPSEAGDRAGRPGGRRGRTRG